MDPTGDEQAAPETVVAGAQAEPAQAAEQLRALFQAKDYNPPRLPSTAVRLVEVARDPNVPLSKIRELIEQDPALAAEVLTIARSTYYSRGSPVETLEEAILRLGVKRLSEIFMDVAMSSTVFKGEGLKRPMETLRRHSTCTAHIGRALCQTLGVPAERAFLCGLLHDVGMGISLVNLSEMNFKFNDDDLAAVLFDVHEEAAQLLGKIWKLPASIAWVLGHHHHYADTGHVTPLAAVTCLADWLASEGGAPVFQELDDDAAFFAAEYFGLDSQIDKLKGTAARIVEQFG